MKKFIFLCLALLVISATSAKAAVNSYELFWPLVAGKTMADGFVYQLKILKEDVRGYLIFGPAQKANYQVFQASKRLLEAEKLVLDKKDDLASLTLDKAIALLSAANKGSANIKLLAADLAIQYSEKTEIAKKLQKISQFAP